MKLLGQCMQVLSEEEMERIYQAAVRVWGHVPLRAQGNEEFTQALRDFGCRVEEDRIWFPEAVREKVLSRIAAERARRGPGRAAWAPNDPIQPITNGQAPYCCDVASQTLRPATTNDLATWCHVCDALPCITRVHPTFLPQDVPPAVRDVHTFATILLHSRQPCRTSVYSAEMLPFFVALQAVWEGSEEAVRRRPIFNVTCYASSPFAISRESLEIAMQARALLGVPIHIYAMPTAGSAAPATLAGTLVQALAEYLCFNTITLALDDRLIGFSPGCTVTDMRSGASIVAGPDYLLLRLASAQLGAYVFGGSYQGGGSLQTTAKVPDVQAVMEKCLDAMWGLWAGVRRFSSVGILATSDAASLTQLVLDLEILNYLQRLVEGIQVDSETLAEEVILQVAPKGAYYLGEEHTARHFRRELWLPSLMDRRTAAAWLENPTEMIESARARAAKLAAEAPNQCPLSEAQQRQVRQIVAEAFAKAKVSAGAPA